MKALAFRWSFENLTADFLYLLQSSTVLRISSFEPSFRGFFLQRLGSCLFIEEEATGGGVAKRLKSRRKIIALRFFSFIHWGIYIYHPKGRSLRVFWGAKNSRVDNSEWTDHSSFWNFQWCCFASVFFFCKLGLLTSVVFLVCFFGFSIVFFRLSF